MLIFCLKPPFNLFLTKNNHKKTIYQSEKTLQFVKVVALLYVVLTKILYKVLSFSLCLNKKQLKKIVAGKKILFAKIVAVVKRVFPKILSNIRPCSFLDKKPKKDRVPVGKILRFVKTIALVYRGFS